MEFTSHITFLPSADLEATDRFYRGRLGLPLERDQGVCRIYRVAGEAHLGFCTHLSSGDSATSGMILTLVTEEVDAWHMRLQEGGADIEHPPRLNERFGIYHFFVRDPDGHRVEIQRFVDEPS